MHCISWRKICLDFWKHSQGEVGRFANEIRKNHFGCFLADVFSFGLLITQRFFFDSTSDEKTPNSQRKSPQNLHNDWFLQGELETHYCQPASTTCAMDLQWCPDQLSTRERGRQTPQTAVQMSVMRQKSEVRAEVRTRRHIKNKPKRLRFSVL